MTKGGGGGEKGRRKGGGMERGGGEGEGRRRGGAVFVNGAAGTDKRGVMYGVIMFMFRYTVTECFDTKKERLCNTNGRQNRER